MMGTKQTGELAGVQAGTMLWVVGSAWRPKVVLALLVAALLVVPAAVIAQDAPERYNVNIISEGVPLAGDLWLPAGIDRDDPSRQVPVVVLANGWGGTKGYLNRGYAAPFARAGYAVLVFDYRGWGASPGRLIAPDRVGDADDTADLEIREVREIVEPFGFLEDIRNALAFASAEPAVDADRMALWGTSLGGGLAVYISAELPQIRALIVQTGSVNTLAGLRNLPAASPLSEASVWQRRAAIARGELDPVPGEESKLAGLRGAMDWGQHRRYDPFARAPDVRAATLVIDVEDEELFDIRQNGGALYEIVREHAPARYDILPGSHYEIYSGPSYERALALQIAWLDEHLKAGDE